MLFVNFSQIHHSTLTRKRVLVFNFLNKSRFLKTSFRLKAFGVVFVVKILRVLCDRTLR